MIGNASRDRARLFTAILVEPSAFPTADSNRSKQSLTEKKSLPRVKIRVSASIHFCALLCLVAAKNRNSAGCRIPLGIDLSQHALFTNGKSDRDRPILPAYPGIDPATIAFPVRPYSRANQNGSATVWRSRLPYCPAVALRGRRRVGRSF